jgi:DNA repair protein SbcD/Mre11
MISFTVRTDCHVHDKAPQSRIDDYLETCLDKLRQIGEFASSRKCTAVLDNGDFFHAKAATKNSHDMVRKVIEVHREYYPCPVYENPGNHDFPYNNIDYLSRQPLGVLFAAGVFQRMGDLTFTDEEGLKVRVVGFPYKSHFDVSEFDLERGDEDILIVAAHTFASPKGGDIFGNETALSYYDLSSCSPDVYIFGHWHIDQGIQTINGKTFMNLGSMTRGSLTQDNINRIPRFGYIEISKDKQGVVSLHTEAVELKVKPAHEIFDLERHTRLQEEQRDIDQFISSLVLSAGEDEGDDILSTIKSLSNFHEEVRDKAIDYLRNAMDE